MSYNISVWTRECVKIEEKEEKINDGFIFCEKSIKVEPEDIPANIRLAFEGIEWLTQLYIEPYPDDEAYIRKIIKKAKEIAKVGKGIAVDEQKGKIYGKAIQEIKISTQKEKKCVWINVYSVPNYAIVDKGDEIFAIFEKYLPNAKPRRYGLYEPPQYKFEECGKNHFFEFWKNNSKLVWYTTAPVEGVYQGDTYSRGQIFKDRWQCNYFSIALSEEVLDYKNWRWTLYMVLQGLMVSLDGFYGEIIRGKGQTKAWFWEGIPQKRGEIFALGQPYTKLLNLTDGKEIKMFTDNDISIPSEFCLATQKDPDTGLMCNIKARCWPFE